MDIRQLITFRMLAQTLSFTRTAAALNYVQSTVTAQIQALETELGVPLFDRLGRRVVLTDAGQRLLHYAERLLALLDEAEHAVTGDKHPSGTLAISATESLCAYRIPRVLREFRARHPQVRLHFRPSIYPEMRHLVSEGIIDVAYLVEDLIRSTELDVVTLCREEVLLVVHPGHPLALAPEVTPDDLSSEATILTESTCMLRVIFERALSEAGVYPTETLTFRNVEAIKQCALAGLGVGVLPGYAVEHELSQEHLVALRWVGADLSLYSQIIWHKDKWLSPALRAFLHVTGEMFEIPELQQYSETEITR